MYDDLSAIINTLDLILDELRESNEERNKLLKIVRLYFAALLEVQCTPTTLEKLVKATNDVMDET